MRVTVVVGLLLAATGCVALSVGTGQWTGAAAVAALLGGVAAARIMQAEVVQARRDAALDRARQAQGYQRLSARSASEHARFATSMTNRLADRERAIVRLRQVLRAALRRADDADELAATESRRAERLQVEVAQLRTALATPAVETAAPAAGVATPDADEVAVWEAGETPSVVDLVAWDQRAADAAGEAAEDWRRRA